MTVFNQQPEDTTWTPTTPNGRPITPNETYQWADLNGSIAPRPVTVSHLDTDERLVIVKDDTNTHYMAIPEELE